MSDDLDKTSGSAKKLTHVYLKHMLLSNRGSGGLSLSNMLVSKAGVGKTSFIKDIAKLIGITAVIIEAPHLVEEKIINIPFIVKAPNSDHVTKGESNTKPMSNEYEIELADSYLYTQLLEAKPLPDAQYITNLYTNSNLVELYESLGGTREEIPKIISDIRSKYKVILFVDEYFRTPSQAITALLRSLLNKEIGMHKLPNYVYVTFASNESDIGGSIRKRMDNERFATHELTTPTKDEWFDWLINNIKDNHKHVNLDMRIMDKFRKELLDEDISSVMPLKGGANDIISMSPRRWEQLLLYINCAFSLDSGTAMTKNDAMALLTNVNLSFLHYIEKESHPVANKVLKAVVDLIQDIAGITLTVSDLHKEKDWRYAFQHQLEMKKKLGDSRKYVPVVAGPAGLGKTTQLAKVADDLDLRLIVVDCARITDPSEVIGIPLRKSGPGGRSEVKFSKSSVYMQIHEQIAMQDLYHKNQLYKEDGGKEKWEEYEQARWKYLIFFDELTVASPAVINALRKVMLEKSFGDTDNAGNELKLPREAIVTCAINPTGAQVKPLTHHMRDVLDIVHANVSWEKQRSYLEMQDLEDVEDDVIDATISAMELFGSHFGDKEHPLDEQMYFLATDATGSVYITPNHLSDAFISATYSIQVALNQTRNKRGTLSDVKGEQMNKVLADLREAFYDAYRPILSDAFKTASFMNDHTKNWIQQYARWIKDPNNNLLISLVTGDDSDRDELSTTLEEHVTGINKHPLHDDTRFINYLKANSKSHIELATDLKQWIIDFFNNCNSEDKIKYFVKPSVTMQSLNAEDDNESLTTYKKPTGPEQIPTKVKVTPMVNLVLQMGLSLVMNGISGEICSSIRHLTTDPVDRLLEQLENDEAIEVDEFNKAHSGASDVADYLESQSGNYDINDGYSSNGGSV